MNFLMLCTNLEIICLRYGGYTPTDCNALAVSAEGVFIAIAGQVFEADWPGTLPITRVELRGDLAGGRAELFGA